MSSISVHQLKGFISSLNDVCKKALVILGRTFSTAEITNPDCKYDYPILYQKILRPLEDNDIDINEEGNPIYDYIKDLGSSPYTSGLLINACYAAPLSPEDVLRIRTESINAESKAFLTFRRPPRINWDAIFTYSEHQHEQHLSKYPAMRPEFNAEIYNTLRIFRDRMAGAVIFPHSGTKGVSSETAANFNASVPFEHTREHVSSNVLLREYMDTGFKAKGRVEVKQQWGTALLKPRTYYSQGGDVYYKSMYLRNIVNTMADIFDPCQRFLRVANRLQKTDPRKRFFLYDFSAFTSNFSEQTYFIEALSDFFQDVYVEVLETEYTWVSRSLGELFREYVAGVNDLPEFYLGSSIPYEFSESLYHLQAGFLGVYANLMTCTIPHAILVNQFVHEDFEQSTAGDDGAVALYDEWTDPFHETMWLVGSYAHDKVGYGVTDYLKRRFEDHDTPILHDIVIYPNLIIAALIRNRNDPRFPHFAHSDPVDLHQSLRGSVMGFYRSIFQMYQGGRQLRAKEEAIVLKFLEDLYNQVDWDVCGNRVPSEANLGSTFCNTLSYPPISTQFMYEDPDEGMRYFLNARRVCIPVIQFKPVELTADAYPGLEVSGNKNTGMSFLERIGVVTAEQCFRVSYDEVEVQMARERDDDDEESDLFQIPISSGESRGGPVYDFVFHREVSISGLLNLGLANREDLFSPFMETATEDRELFFTKRRRKSATFQHTRYLDLDHPIEDNTMFLYYDDVSYRQPGGKRLKMDISFEMATRGEREETPVVDPLFDGTYVLE